MRRLHPREQVVTAAELALREALIQWRRDHQGLTWGELFSILGAVLGEQVTGVAKYLIREERHGDQDKPGGVE